MPRDQGPAPDTPGHETPDRQPREYPHGSGDRNAFSPTRDDPMPRHEGGTQRKAPPSAPEDAG